MLWFFFSKIRQSVDSGIWTECKILSKLLMFVFNFFAHGSTALNGVLIVEVIDHSHTPHSVRLLWTSDRPIAETST